MKNKLTILLVFISFCSQAQWSNTGYNYTTGSLLIGISGTTSEKLKAISSGTERSVALFGATGTGIAGIYFDASNGDFIGSDYGSLLQNDDLSISLSNGGNNPIFFQTSNTPRLTISGSGNIGIGISSPSEKLSIANGNILIDNVDGKGLKINQEDSRRYGRIVIEKGTGTGLGTTNTLLIEANNTYGSQYNQRILFRTAVTDRLVIEHDGNVGIGTTTPDYKLDVLGTIRATEIKVATDWSDFVFDPDYDLKSLEQVEEFIDKNGHLPDIPSAEEVEENGISLGAMDAKLLQKIEELTLYMLEMKKENDLQANEIEQLKIKLNTK